MIVWGLATLLAVLLVAQEWRRPDHRRRVLRAALVVLAAAALAALADPPMLPGRPGPDGVVILLTPGADPPLRRHLEDSLPGSPVAVWPDSIRDLGAVRRRWPAARTVMVAGWGLREAWWSDLGGLALRTAPAPVPPGVSHLSWPRQVVLGDRARITGRVSAATPAGRVHLEGPGGERDSVAVSGDSTPVFEFEVTPTAAGLARYVLAPEHAPPETVGLAVVAARPPAILILEGSPSFETRFLRRWLAGQGARVAIRTRLSRDRDRIEQVNLPGLDLGSLTSALLDRFDLVMLDGPTLAALGPAERRALGAAVREGGLGLIVAADSAARADRDYFPFEVAPLGDGEDRQVRPRWEGQVAPATAPVPAAPGEFLDRPGQQALVRDPVGRVLAAVTRQGAGRVASSLLLAPSRWLLEEEPGAFAAYWARLVSATARPPGESWGLAADGPLVPGLPLSLVLSTTDPEPQATVRAPSGATDTLGLVQDLADPTRWWGRYWPRESGWHSATNRDGAPYSFDVESAAGPAREAAARLAATARRAELLSPAGGAAESVPTRRPLPSWIPFLLLVGALGILWGEGRLAGGR